jgi:hypothetical protein
MDGKIRHRPKTFMKVQDSILPFSSSNLINNGEVRTCPATQTLFGFQLISRVLEVQMSSGFFIGKLRQLPIAFMEQRAQILAKQQYQKFANNIKNQQPTMSKTSHQINGRPPTIFLVHQSIVLNLSI